MRYSRYVILLVFTIILAINLTYAKSFLLSENGSGRATAYSSSNKVVTFEGKTHVAWLDTIVDEFVVNIRTLDNDSGEWSATYRVDEAYNNHGGPALTMDAEGYLHITYYAHHHPVRYRRSVRPNDASEWGPVESFGNNLTYPAVVCTPDGTLIFAGRRSYPIDEENRPWEIEMWKREPGADWKKLGPVVRSRYGHYSHFHHSLAWSPDHQTLHLAANLNETPPESVAETDDTRQQWRFTTVVHMKSNDLGRTWNRWDGTPIEVPVTIKDMDRIASARGDEGFRLRLAAMDVNPDGIPYIPWTLQINNTSQAFLSFPSESNSWEHIHLNRFIPQGWPRDILTTYGGISFDESGNLHLSAMVRGSWADPESEIIRFMSTDGGEYFRAEIISPRNPTVPYWLPSIERRTGFNRVEHSPAILFTGGEAGDFTNMTILENEVWFDR